MNITRDSFYNTRIINFISKTNKSKLSTQAEYYKADYKLFHNSFIKIRQVMYKSQYTFSRDSLAYLAKETKLPKGYRYLSIITILITFLPLLFALVDFTFGLTKISIAEYLTASLSGGVLFVTVCVAKKQWRKKKEYLCARLLYTAKD